MKFDDTGWLDTAIEIDYTDKSMDRNGYKLTHIVIHGTAGGRRAEDIANMVFKDPNIEASSHFIIGQDGHIVQVVPCSLAAWGNGVLDNPAFSFPENINPNFYTLSIEHCKPSIDNSDQLTDLQKQASFQLVNALCNQYNIDKRRGDEKGGIISHADLDSVNRARCPGVYPWSELIAYLKGNIMQPSQPQVITTKIPDGWTYDTNDKSLSVNNFKITNGFCQWVLTHNWDKDNIPLTNSMGMNPVEQGNKMLGGGTVQVFRKTILVWTNATNVYEMWVGQEYIALYQLLQQMQSQNQILTNQVKLLQTQLDTNQTPNVHTASTSIQSIISVTNQIASLLGSLQSDAVQAVNALAN